ncbi:MAG TPA: DUF6119 family protein, partial [Chitinophagaceae bacterium]|nr:DUF6119 family protein [Chitinophagaceae bacterium]
MAEREKIQATIYQIDLTLFETSDFEYVVDAIIKKAKEGNLDFKEDKLVTNTFGEHTIRIFHCVKTNPPKWSGFLKKILAENAVLANCINSTHSFICFVNYKKQIFVTCGGLGNFAVQRFVSQNFGMEILVRLFQKNDKVVKAIQDRGVTGIILGQTKYYRGDQRLSDENEFGKVYKQVQAELSTPILTKIFGFKHDELKRNVSGCLAKNSFQITKAIDFDTLLRLIDRFIEILKKDGNFTLNKVTQIVKKGAHNTKLIDELDDFLVEHLYNECINDREPDFDFCHPEFDKFLTASGYSLELDAEDPIPLEAPLSLAQVISVLKKNDTLLIDDKFQYKHSVLQRIIKAVDDEGNPLTQGSVLEHLHGEITCNKNTYFLIDGFWYKIHPDFIEDLNQGCKDLLFQAWTDGLIKETFDLKKRESTFNEKFLGKKNTFVFDSITPENIEACDILKYDDTNVYLIHVKKGFNNSLRDLAAQVAIAAKRLE